MQSRLDPPPYDGDIQKAPDLLDQGSRERTGKRPLKGENIRLWVLTFFNVVFLLAFMGELNISEVDYMLASVRRPSDSEEDWSWLSFAFRPLSLAMTIVGSFNLVWDLLECYLWTLGHTLLSLLCSAADLLFFVAWVVLLVLCVIPSSPIRAWFTGQDQIWEEWVEDDYTPPSSWHVPVSSSVGFVLLAIVVLLQLLRCLCTLARPVRPLLKQVGSRNRDDLELVRSVGGMTNAQRVAMF